MLFRVRTTMSDRPGSLAALARGCGEQGANILGLQIFPGVEGVTDELVLRAPDSWGLAEVAELVEGAGGTHVTVGPCTEHALVDGPIQYLHGLRRLAHDTRALADVLARLLDATPALPEHDELEAVQDTLTVAVGPHRVTLRRTAPFTATEHARAVAFAEVAAELVGAIPSTRCTTSRPPPRRTPRDCPPSGSPPSTTPPPLVRMHGRCSADSVYRRYAAPLARIDERFARRLLLAGNGALVATVGDEVVGIASISTCENAHRRGVPAGRGRLAAARPRHPAALRRGPAGPRAGRRRGGAAQPHPQPGADVAGVRLRAAAPGSGSTATRSS